MSRASVSINVLGNWRCRVVLSGWSESEPDDSGTRWTSPRASPPSRAESRVLSRLLPKAGGARKAAPGPTAASCARVRKGCGRRNGGHQAGGRVPWVWRCQGVCHVAVTASALFLSASSLHGHGAGRNGTVTLTDPKTTPWTVFKFSKSTVAAMHEPEEAV